MKDKFNHGWQQVGKTTILEKKKKKKKEEEEENKKQKKKKTSLELPRSLMSCFSFTDWEHHSGPFVFLAEYDIVELTEV